MLLGHVLCSDVARHLWIGVRGGGAEGGGLRGGGSPPPKINSNDDGNNNNDDNNNDHNRNHNHNHYHDHDDNNKRACCVIPVSRRRGWIPGSHRDAQHHCSSLASEPLGAQNSAESSHSKKMCSVTLVTYIGFTLIHVPPRPGMKYPVRGNPSLRQHAFVCVCFNMCLVALFEHCVFHESPPGVSVIRCVCF